MSVIKLLHTSVKWQQELNVKRKDCFELYQIDDEDEKRYPARNDVLTTATDK